LKRPSEGEHWPTSSFVEIAKGHNELLLAAMEIIRIHTHAGTKPKDPRTRYNCDYHSHGKDEECLVKKER
jgi:hypothetical protein